MSAEKNCRVAYKSIVDGASFHLEKPISLDDLKYIWQHVYRKELYLKNKEAEKAAAGTGGGNIVSCGKELTQGIKINEAAEGGGGDGSRQPLQPPPASASAFASRTGFQGTTDHQLITSINEMKGKNKMVVEEPEVIILDDSPVVESQIPPDSTEHVMMTTEESEQQGVDQSKIKRSNVEKEGKRKQKRTKVKSSPKVTTTNACKTKEIAITTEEEAAGKGKDDDNNQSSSNSTGRKPRLVWNSELHRKFTAALSALGDRNARPKSILELMNEPTLTQRQVASHLQKYKAQVQRLQSSTSEIPLFGCPASIYGSTGCSHMLEKNTTEWSQLGLKGPNFSLGADTLLFPKASPPVPTCSLYQIQQLANMPQVSAADSSSVNQNQVMVTISSGYGVPKAGKSPMKITTGNQEEDAMGGLDPPECSENQDQSLSLEFADLLKALDEDLDDQSKGGDELPPGDVDQFCDSLRKALLGNNEQP